MKQTDIYIEALACLRLVLQTDHPEFRNWLDWLGRGIEGWTQRQEVAHHLLAYGGMGSFNDLPNMRGSHNHIFDSLKSVCCTFGHHNDKRQGISSETLMEKYVHDAERVSYHPHKGLNRTIA